MGGSIHHHERNQMRHTVKQNLVDEAIQIDLTKVKGNNPSKNEKIKGKMKKSDWMETQICVSTHVTWHSSL
jgi:hypothetical protein